MPSCQTASISPLKLQAPIHKPQTSSTALHGVHSKLPRTPALGTRTNTVRPQSDGRMLVSGAFTTMANQNPWTRCLFPSFFVLCGHPNRAPVFIRAPFGDAI